MQKLRKKVSLSLPFGHLDFQFLKTQKLFQNNLFSFHFLTIGQTKSSQFCLKLILQNPSHARYL